MADVIRVKKIKDTSGTDHEIAARSLLDSSDNELTPSTAGNAAANTVVARNANGSIQTEKLAVSSGTTTKATIQYNTTDDCIDFIFN